jgi:hypothetical protein
MGSAAIAWLYVIWTAAMVAPIIVAQLTAGAIVKSEVTDEVVNLPIFVAPQFVA